jgi:hypothetical protein
MAASLARGFDFANQIEPPRRKDAKIFLVPLAFLRLDGSSENRVHNFQLSSRWFSGEFLQCEMKQLDLRGTQSSPCLPPSTDTRAKTEWSR